MVPKLCRYKWHSSGQKAHIPGEGFCCLYSKYAIDHPVHTVPGIDVIWERKHKVASATKSHHRTPLLNLCVRLRIRKDAWSGNTCYRGGSRRTSLPSEKRHQRNPSLDSAWDTQNSLMKRVKMKHFQIK